MQEGNGCCTGQQEKTMKDLQSDMAQIICILRCINWQLIENVLDPHRLQRGLAEAREIVDRLERRLWQMAEQAEEKEA